MATRLRDVVLVGLAILITAGSLLPSSAAACTTAAFAYDEEASVGTEQNETVDRLVDPDAALPRDQLSARRYGYDDRANLVRTNASRSVGFFAPNTAGSMSGSALANAGRGAEDLVGARIGLARNAGAGRVTVPGSSAGGYRVPDFNPFGRTGTIATRGTVVEVKDVASLSSSPQLRDLVGFAQGQGVPLEIFTNATLPGSGQLYNWIRSGQVIISPL